MVNDYKKILTIEELVNFCEKQKLFTFSSKESGYPLAVKISTMFEEVENVDENHKGMMKLKFRIFHTGLNRNGSFVSENAAKKAMKTISDRPVLAAIHQLNDGTWDFEGHEIELIKNENGETEYHYIESQVGSFTSEPAFWEHDDNLGKDYVCAYAYIPEEYTKAAEIIRNKNGTKNSCELVVNEFSYNAKEHYLDLTDFFVNGSTLLGRKADGTEIGEGMVGSRADICDFSVENNSAITENNAIEVLEKIKTALSTFDIQENSGKEENQVEDNKPVEMEVELESTTGEEVTTDEDTSVVTPETEDFQTEDTEVDVENNTGDETETESSGDAVDAQFTVNINGKTMTYSVSLNDKLNAMYGLVNETYGELDDDYYDVVMFDDTKTVEMHGWFRGKSYRQSYKVKKDNYQLVGDRVEISAVWMTADEEAKFNSMKENYSVISNKLQKYEDEPKKVEILASQKYGYIADTEEFTALQADHFDMSIEDVTKKADEILLSYAESGSLKFSIDEKVEKPTVKSVSLFCGKKKESRYGSLFSKQ